MFKLLAIKTALRKVPKALWVYLGIALLTVLVLWGSYNRGYSAGEADCKEAQRVRQDAALAIELSKLQEELRKAREVQEKGSTQVGQLQEDRAQARSKIQELEEALRDAKGSDPACNIPSPERLRLYKDMLSDVPSRSS